VGVVGFADEFLHQPGHGAGGGAGGELGWRGDGAVLGVFDDFFDGGFGLGAFAGGQLRREIDAGDLEAVEEEAGAARVDLVLGDAAEDFADVVLDGGAVFGEEQIELGVVAAVGDGFAHARAAGGVVVVAEVRVAKGAAAAAAAVGEEVLALPGFGGAGCGDVGFDV
jgi:hypothetical protein